MTYIGYGTLAATGLWLLDAWIRRRVAQGLAWYHAQLEEGMKEAEEEIAAGTAAGNGGGTSE